MQVTLDNFDDQQFFDAGFTKALQSAVFQSYVATIDGNEVRVTVFCVGPMGVKINDVWMLSKVESFDELMDLIRANLIAV